MRQATLHPDDAAAVRAEAAFVAASRGLSPDATDALVAFAQAEAETQLARLTGPSPTVRLDRPAVRGDGIDTLTAADEAAWAAAAAAGRVTSFIPASGAATRLCQDLLAVWEGEAPSAAAEAVLDGAAQLALWPRLAEAGAAAGDRERTLEALLGTLRVHTWPKALVPFHDDPRGPRTAIDAQVDEAVALGLDAEGVTRLHLTAPVAHHAAMAAVLEAAAARVAASGRALRWALSDQDPATDTLAATLGGRLARRSDGLPLRRPGGHGALLSNLAALAADGASLVLVKNIDNVRPEAAFTAEVAPWRRRLAGRLATLVDAAWAHVRALRAAAAGAEPAAAAFAHEVLGVDLPPTREALLARLHRPWRVAGMVPAAGHTGGGPFWAHGPDGVGLQIVEGVHVGPAQAAVAAASTHFNPVDLALMLRDADGEPFDLSAYTDPEAVIVTRKVHGGEPLLALEHPGLWNGGMAGWNTVFVEMPAASFAPVKVLADLLSPLHRG